VKIRGSELIRSRRRARRRGREKKRKGEEERRRGVTKKGQKAKIY